MCEVVGLLSRSVMASVLKVARKQRSEFGYAHAAGMFTAYCLAVAGKSRSCEQANRIAARLTRLSAQVRHNA